MSLSPGDRLGAYEIVGKIGAGGMGEVYRARDLRLDRTVAIKVLSEEIAGDQGLRVRFEREARAVAALNHPHICVLHDIGEHEGTGYFVMEYLDGQPMSDRLREGPLPLDQVFRYGIQIAQALGKAHVHGITHRDIKPGNIMLSKSGAKLLDFGLAKVSEAASVNELTKPPSARTEHGIILGTPQYMAPEQLRGGAVDARTDIFAFGAVLYEMLTGDRPFIGADQASVVAATLAKDPAAITVRRPDVPAALERLVLQCLAKSPDDRWQSIRDVELELEWLQRSHGAISRSQTVSHPGLAWAVAGAAIAAAIAISAMAYRRSGSAPPVTARFELSTPFTNEPASFAVSPDGQQVIFTGLADGVQKLWLRQLNQFEAQVIGGTDRGVDPFFAPDGRSIGFFADGKLKRLDLSGGAPQVLADAPTPRGGAWSSDGTIIFTPTTVSPLMRVPAGGGTVRPATALVTGQNSHRWPQFLPGGRDFIFLSTFGALETQGVFMSALDSTVIKRVLNENSPAVYAAPGRLLFVREGALVAVGFDATSGVVNGEPTRIEPLIGFDASLIRAAFSVSTSGVLVFRGATTGARQLTWIDRKGRTVGTLGEADMGAPAAPDLSRDGRRAVLFKTQQSNADVWQILTAAGVPTRLTFDANADVAPVWSSDGERIYYSSGRQGPISLFEHVMNGAAPDRALDPNAPDSRIANAVSPDGRYLLYTSLTPTTGVDLWAMPTNGEQSFVVLQTPFDEMAGQISPNGRWLAYQSTATGRIEVYITSFPKAGAQQQVSTAGGGQARWSADGRELFYVAADGTMMAVPITERSAQDLDIGTPAALFSVPIATGTNIPGAVGTRPQYAIAPDGKFLINASVPGAAMPPISVVLDWRSKGR